MTDRRQGALYVLVGAGNTAFGLASFAALQLSLGKVVHYLVVLIVAWIVNITESYLAYRYLVFKVHGHFWRDLARFSLVYAGAFGFNLAALPLGVDVLGMPVILAQTCVLVVTVGGTFVAHRAFSFHRPDPAAAAFAEELADRERRGQERGGSSTSSASASDVLPSGR